MFSKPLALSSFPRAVMHIDGDAFFASCEQSRNPQFKGRPIVTGKERGIAASLSYEAKARGVKRGMRIFEIRKVCPDVIVVPSDYETYSLLSRRFFSIVRRYTSAVEEYGIDECFADITGLRRPLHKSYLQIAENIQNDLKTELGFTFSIGLGPNKVIAKIASKWKKPCGLTVIPANKIHLYLEKLPVENVWGIGHQTAAFLDKQGVTTALQFARQSEETVKKNFSKPFYEIWQELNGRQILEIDPEEKTVYHSIQKVKTFTPPSSDRRFILAQLSKNIENACIKSRRYGLAADSAVFFLRTQDFQNFGVEVKFSRLTAFPSEIIRAIEPYFDKIYNPDFLYRSTGIILFKLEAAKVRQMDIFGIHAKIERLSRLYQSVDNLQNKFGKHALFIGSSFLAHEAPRLYTRNNCQSFGGAKSLEAKEKITPLSTGWRPRSFAKGDEFGQHLGDRGDIPQRHQNLLPGETSRKRLGIPMMMGVVK